MERLTISELSEHFSITSRTLRYYEEIGLIRSMREEQNSYRIYDQNVVKRLEQIIILRKLRIKLQDIARILDHPEALTMIDVFEENMKEVNEELVSLDKIRTIYEEFLVRIRDQKTEPIALDFLDQKVLADSLRSIPIKKCKLKEEKGEMESLKQAGKIVEKLRDEEVRIVYLPSYTVAAVHYIGESPEDHAESLLTQFIMDHNIAESYPELRVFGFNNPCAKSSDATYGYEYWVTIPKDIIVPDGVEKKIFKGGMYAVYSIRMGEFEKWKRLVEWVNHSRDYEYERREPYGMDGSLEEHLNAYHRYGIMQAKQGFTQLDLMIPIRERVKFPE